MATILQEFMTPQLMAVVGLVCAALVVLYVLQIVFINIDAGRRGANRVLWTIVGIIPIIGLIAYQVLRPTFYLSDQHEQEIQEVLAERQLEDYGTCPKCKHIIKSSYVCCPHCGTQVNNVCPTCRRPVSPRFSYCPYCQTPVGMSSQSLATNAAARQQQ